MCECLELPYGLLDCSYVRPNLTTTTTEIITFTTTETTTVQETTSLSTVTEVSTTEQLTTTNVSTSELSSTELTTQQIDLTTIKNVDVQETVEPRTVEDTSTTTQDITTFINTTFTDYTTEKITLMPDVTDLTTFILTSSEEIYTVTTPSGFLNVTDISHFFTDEPDERPGLTVTEPDTTIAWTSSPTTNHTFTPYFDLTTSPTTAVHGTECKNLYCENGGTCIATHGAAKVK